MSTSSIVRLRAATAARVELASPVRWAAMAALAAARRSANRPATAAVDLAGMGKSTAGMGASADLAAAAGVDSISTATEAPAVYSAAWAESPILMRQVPGAAVGLDWVEPCTCAAEV